MTKKILLALFIINASFSLITLSLFFLDYNIGEIIWSLFILSSFIFSPYLLTLLFVVHYPTNEYVSQIHITDYNESYCSKNYYSSHYW